MSKFTDLAKRDSNLTTTENGAIALRSTGNDLLNLFSTIGALRNAKKDRITSLWKNAYAEDADLAMKTLFYARDVRGGLGERDVFRTIIRHLAHTNPESVNRNLSYVGFYGRFDDLYSLVGTPCESAMWEVMGNQFKMDLENMKAGKPVSLLAKWIKTPDSSSKETRKMGILTSQKLGYKNVKEFKRDLKTLRKYLDIPEIKMSANKWNTICYEKVPARCMLRYRSNFRSHDEERFNAYIDDVKSGKAEIKAGTLYPYDITRKYLLGVERDNDVMEAQWNALPNYIEEGRNILVVADVSGSMTCNEMRPMATSIGLAMYFAERNVGDFHNLFMTFSENPRFETLRGNTLEERINNLHHADWGYNTNLDRVFGKVLSMSKKNNIPQEEMPEAIVVVSDMEIDRGFRNDLDETFYDHWKEEFARAGYEIPNVIFWNVNSKSDVFHFDQDRKGVQAYSGSSASTFKSVLKCLDMTPVEAMLEVLSDERYAPIVAEGSPLVKVEDMVESEDVEEDIER